jgi:hypothetical protein
MIHAVRWKYTLGSRSQLPNCAFLRRGRGRARPQTGPAGLPSHRGTFRVKCYKVEQNFCSAGRGPYFFISALVHCHWKAVASYLDTTLTYSSKRLHSSSRCCCALFLRWAAPRGWPSLPVCSRSQIGARTLRTLGCTYMSRITGQQTQQSSLR